MAEELRAPFLAAGADSHRSASCCRPRVAWRLEVGLVALLSRSSIWSVTRFASCWPRLRALCVDMAWMDKGKERVLRFEPVSGSH